MRIQKLFSWFLVLVLMLATVAGCKASGPTAIELVPRYANLIANIQVDKIINDQDLEDSYYRITRSLGQRQTVSEALDEIFEETGIDPRHISEIVIFGDMAVSEPEDYLGLIIEGTFDDEEFIHNFEEQTGEEFTTSDYRGYILYIDEWEGYGITFLSDGIVIIGATEAVKDTIDVNEGDIEMASGTILDTYNRSGDALIKVAFEVPTEMRELMTEEPIPDYADMPINTEPFAEINVVGFSISKEADTLTTQTELRFTNKDSAQDANDVLSGAISLFKGLSPVPEVKELLDKIEVTVNDSWLTIAYAITLSEIEHLIETYQ